MQLPPAAEGGRRTSVQALLPPSKKGECILPLRSPNFTGSMLYQDTIQVYAEDPSAVTSPRLRDRTKHTDTPRPSSTGSSAAQKRMEKKSAIVDRRPIPPLLSEPMPTAGRPMIHNAILLHAWRFAQEHPNEFTDKQIQTCFASMRSETNCFIQAVQTRVHSLPIGKKNTPQMKALLEANSFKAMSRTLKKIREYPLIRQVISELGKQNQEPTLAILIGKAGKNWQKEQLTREISHIITVLQQFSSCQGQNWHWQTINSTGQVPESAFPGNLDIPQIIRALYADSHPILNLTVNGREIPSSDSEKTYFSNLLTLLEKEKFLVGLVPNEKEDPLQLSHEEILEDILSPEAPGRTFFAKALRTVHSSIWKEQALKLKEIMQESRSTESSLILASSALKGIEPLRSNITCINPFTVRTVLERTEGLALRLFPAKRAVVATLPVTLEVIMIGSPTGHTIWNRTVKFGENMSTHALP